MIKESEQIENLILCYKLTKDDKRKRLYHLALVDEGMKLVKKISKGIARRTGSNFDELIQVGSLGLIKSIDSFRTDENAKFQTYATHFIKGEIMHFIRDKLPLVRRPRAVYELIPKIKDALAKLKEEGNFSPTVDELAEMIQTDPSKIAEAELIEACRYTISLDQETFDDENGVPLIEKLPIHYNNEIQEPDYEIKIDINDALNQLSPELRNVVDLCYFQDLTQMEVARILKLSRMQVSRRLRKALNQMYDYIKTSEE